MHEDLQGTRDQRARLSFWTWLTFAALMTGSLLTMVALLGLTMKTSKALARLPAVRLGDIDKPGTPARFKIDGVKLVGPARPFEKQGEVLAGELRVIAVRSLGGKRRKSAERVMYEHLREPGPLALVIGDQRRAIRIAEQALPWQTRRLRARLDRVRDGEGPRAPSRVVSASLNGATWHFQPEELKYDVAPTVRVQCRIIPAEATVTAVAKKPSKPDAPLEVESIHYGTEDAIRRSGRAARAGALVLGLLMLGAGVLFAMKVQAIKRELES